MQFNPKEALSRIDNDTGLLALLISVFIKECPNYIQKLQSACDQQNLGALGDAAHNVKGASAAIGFDEANKLAEALEIACRQSGVKSISSFEKSTKELVEVLTNCPAPLKQWASENT